MIQDKLISEQQRIKDEIMEFYKKKKLYTETKEWRRASNFENSRTITEEQKELLQSRFEEREVPRCSKMCAMDKALGPHGFKMGLYQMLEGAQTGHHGGISQFPF